MKKLVISAAFALTLASCATTPTNSNIAQIQQAAVNICKFLPTAQTVAGILISSSSMVLATANAVASAICSAVTTNPLADGPGAKNYKPHVNGVPVKGKFVK